MNNESGSLTNIEESPPPFLGSWKNIYSLVLLNLAILILLFYLFTKVFE